MLRTWKDKTLFGVFALVVIGALWAATAYAAHSRFEFVKCWEARRVGSNRIAVHIIAEPGDNIVLKVRDSIEVKHADGSETVYFSSGILACQAYRPADIAAIIGSSQ